MPSHGQVAQKVREAKEKTPEFYCSAKNCLWRIKPGWSTEIKDDGGYCPRHQHLRKEKTLHGSTTV